MAKLVDHDVKDIALATEGKLKIEWAGEQMPVLRSLREKFLQNKPLKGIKLGACLHVTSETANLMIVLKEAGADVALCASNPLSTQDEVAAALVKEYGIKTFAIKGEDNTSYYKHLNQVLDYRPQITMDDGADLVTMLHTERPKQLTEVIGSSEETTTGVIRLRAMAKDKTLAIPVIAANDSDTKHLFDNRYGTGQSTIDGILRATNILLAGKTFVVVGYGNCGRGLAERASGMGARVLVVEVDPVRALQAAMDGYGVYRMLQAAKWGDIFVAVTGDKHVISLEAMKRMKDRAIVANAGHFDVEIDLAGLRELAGKPRKVRPMVDEYRLGKKRLYVLGEGRLVNLAAADGHPAEVMDMSFSIQAMAAEYLALHGKSMLPKVYVLPKRLDRKVAKLKLASMGMGVERLTRAQRKYLTSWQEGT